MAHPTRSLRPPPCSQGDEQTEKRWTISAAHFGDDGSNLLSATSNRSAPYAWDRITGGDDVRVSIGGHALPFTSTSAKPVFASDISGAEWTVTPEVRTGAVVLVLTAEDQTESAGIVESVTVTNAGSGYTSVPAVTFTAAPSGGTTATATATLAEVGHDRYQNLHWARQTLRQAASGPARGRVMTVHARGSP